MSFDLYLSYLMPINFLIHTPDGRRLSLQISSTLSKLIRTGVTPSSPAIRRKDISGKKRVMSSAYYAGNKNMDSCGVWSISGWSIIVGGLREVGSYGSQGISGTGRISLRTGRNRSYGGEYPFTSAVVDVDERPPVADDVDYETIMTRCERSIVYRTQ